MTIENDNILSNYPDWQKLAQQTEDHNLEVDQDHEKEIKGQNLTPDDLEALQEDKEDQKVSIDDLKACLQEVVNDLSNSVHDKVSNYLDHWRDYRYSVDYLGNYDNLNAAVDCDDFSTLAVCIVWDQFLKAELLND